MNLYMDDEISYFSSNLLFWLKYSLKGNVINNCFLSENHNIYKKGIASTRYVSFSFMKVIAICFHLYVSPRMT